MKLKCVTILAVDDNPAILTALKICLEGVFGRVITLSSPEGVLSTLQQEHVDLILLDMNFSPGVNSGREGMIWLSSTFHRLLISNDGHVIPNDVAREIFVPFFTTRPQGSGIGLSLARQILMMQRLSLSLRERPVCGYNVTFEIEDVRL